MKGIKGMKAVICEKKNSTKNLVLQEVKKPIPNDDEVLVKIYSVSVNAADYRSMKMGIIPKGKIFGSDIAGRVEAIGKNVKLFAINAEVLADISACGLGGFGEYVVVPESVLVKKPSSVSFELAAAVPMAAVTALQALRNVGQIQSKQKVLIFGAGGGVGTFAVQLAKYFEGEVTAVCGSKNVDLMRSLGADHVIDYTQDDFSQSETRYDLVVAVNGSQPLSTYKHALTPKGTLVVVGGALSQVLKSLILGSIMSLGAKKVRTLSAKPNTKDLEWIIKLVEDGSIKPVIDQRYALNETAEAMSYLGKGHAHGKVIINVVNEDK
jgi:NADPH:quinone reductase-like Zn-dependent oxidoreductase